MCWWSTLDLFFLSVYLHSIVMLLATHLISHVSVRHQGMMTEREIIMKKSVFKTSSEIWRINSVKHTRRGAYISVPNLLKLSCPCNRLIVFKNKKILLFFLFCSKVLLRNLDLKALTLTTLLLSFRTSFLCINDFSDDSPNCIYFCLFVDLLGKCKDNLSWESATLIAYGSMTTNIVTSRYWAVWKFLLLLK